MPDPEIYDQLVEIDPWQPVVAATAVLGLAQECEYPAAKIVVVETASVEAVAHALGALINVLYSYADENWNELTAQRGTAETVATTQLNGAVSAAGTTVTLDDSSTGDFDVVGRKWFILDGVTYANSESVLTLSDAANVVTLAHPLLRLHANNTNVYDRVDEYVFAIPDAARHVQVFANNDDSDSDFAFTSRLLQVIKR